MKWKEIESYKLKRKKKFTFISFKRIIFGLGEGDTEQVFFIYIYNNQVY
jgi:hypothetical protein